MKTIIAFLSIGLASVWTSFAQTSPENPGHPAMAPYEATGKLLSAIQNGGTVADVKYCLDNGANVNAEDHDSWHPLQLAAKRGDVDIVKLLLERGAVVDATNAYNTTAFYSATKRDHLDISKLLLDKGAKVNVRTSDNYTLIGDVAKESSTNALGLLFEHGADLNATNWDGDTALIIAAEANRVEMVRYLLALGANVKCEDFLGRNALELANATGNIAIIQMLKKAGSVKSSSIQRQETLDTDLQNLKQAEGAPDQAFAKADGTRSAPLTTMPSLPPGLVDSSGTVTNPDLLMPFTLTNTAGVEITDAVLVKLMPNKFIYKTSSGGGMLRLAALPKDLREKAGYDPDVAAQADQAEREKKNQQQAIRAQRQQQLAAQPYPGGDGQQSQSVTALIRAAAEAKWPDNYEMQKYEIEQQTTAYNWVYSTTSATGVPQSVFDNIKTKAVNKWPNKYDMQEYEINNQVDAYRALH